MHLGMHDNTSMMQWGKESVYLSDFHSLMVLSQTNEMLNLQKIKPLIDETIIIGGYQFGIHLNSVVITSEVNSNDHGLDG